MVNICIKFDIKDKNGFQRLKLSLIIVNSVFGCYEKFKKNLKWHWLFGFSTESSKGCYTFNLLSF